jgi:hypothetical protein
VTVQIGGILDFSLSHILTSTDHTSVNSIDDMLATELPEDATEAWKQDLSDRIEEIIDRKRSSAQGREITLNVYTHYLMSHYAFDQIKHKTSELLPALLKSIKVDNTEKEICLALRGLCNSRHHFHYSTNNRL